MARLADSEAVIWRQAEQIRRLRVQLREHQQWLAVLARRQAGVLIIDLAELAQLPSGTRIVTADRPDGSLVLRAETGEQVSEQRQPGRRG